MQLCLHTPALAGSGASEACTCMPRLQQPGACLYPTPTWTKDIDWPAELLHHTPTWIQAFDGLPACRDIPALEELCYDYCYKAGSVPEKEINCRCGSRNCRKKLL